MKKFTISILLLSTIFVGNVVGMDDHNNPLKELTIKNIQAYFFENKENQHVNNLIRKNNNKDLVKFFERFSNNIHIKTDKKTLLFKKIPIDPCHVPNLGDHPFNPEKITSCETYDRHLYLDAIITDCNLKHKTFEKNSCEEITLKKVLTSLGENNDKTLWTAQKKATMRHVISLNFEQLKNPSLKKNQWKTQRKEGTWSFQPSLSIKQYMLYLAIAEEYQDKKQPIHIAKHKSAYGVVCSLPVKERNRLAHELKLITLPFFRRKIDWAKENPRKTIISSVAGAGTILGLSSIILVKYLKNKK